MSDILSEVFQNLLLASRDAAVLALGVAAVLLAFGRWIAPAWRHLLWMLVALRLVLPVLPTSPTSWQRLVPEEAPEVVTVAGEAPDDGIAIPVSSGETSPQISAALFPDDVPADSLGATVPVLPEPERESSRKKTVVTLTSLTTWQLLGIAWATGLAIVLSLIGVVTLRFLRRLRRLTIDGHPQFAEIHSLLETICREAGLRRVPRLRITEAVLSPALTGLFRPEILLPPTAIEKLNVSELRLVLLHELGHLHRRDVWSNWLLSILQALHWFNPLVWWAFRRTRIEAERATDAWVLENSGEGQAESYGQALIHLLKSSARPSVVPGVVGVIESRRDLRKRLLAIGRFTGKGSRLAALGAGVLLMGIAAIGLTQAPDEEETVFEFEVDVLVLDGREPVPGAVVRLYLYESPDSYMRGEMIYEGQADQNAEFQMTFEASSMLVLLQVESASGQLRGGRILRAKTEGLVRPQDPIDESQKDLWRKQPVFSTQLVSMQFLYENGEPIYPLSLHVQAYASDPIISLMYSVLEDLKTDEEGRCTVKLPSGHQVVIKHDRHDLTNIKVNRGSFVPPENGAEVTFTLFPAFTLKGQVTLPDGTPIDAHITNKLLGSNNLSAETDGEGRYEIHHLEPTNHVFRVSVEFEHGEEWVFEPQEVVISDQSKVTVHNFSPKQGGILNVRFIDKVSNELVVTTPHPGIDTKTTTLHVGALDLPEGYHEPDGNDVEFDFGDKTEITIDALVKPIAPEDTVKGRVVDTQGNPIFRAKVYVSPKIFPDPILTNKKGEFSHFFPDRVISGHKEATIYAEYKGKSSSKMQWTRGSADEVELVIRKEDEGIVTGRVVDDRGAPIADAEVLLWSTDFFEFRRTVKTDEQGQYRFENARSGGELVVNAKHPEYGKDDYRGSRVDGEWVALSVEPGEEVSVTDIELPIANQSISGRVVDSKGELVSNVRIAIRGGLQSDITTNTSPDGKFELGGIVEGWLWVEAGINSVDGKFFLGKKRVHSGSEDIEIRLGAKPDKWMPEKIVDFTGKAAPPLQIAKWYHTDGLSPLVKGKVRVIRFVGIDRSLRYFSNSLQSLEKLRKQYKDNGDLEIVAVHGSWPSEEVEEILTAKYPDFDIPLGIESEANPASRSFGVHYWLSIVIDRDGKVVLQTKKWSEVKAKVDELMGKQVAGTLKEQSPKLGVKRASASSGKSVPIEKAKPVEGSDSLNFLVVGSEGQPVSQANIFVFHPAGKLHSCELVHSLLTDGDGKTSLPFDKVDVGYLIAFSKKKGSGGALFFANKNKNNIPELITILIKPTTNLSLRVIDQQGKAVSGLKLHVAKILGEPNFSHMLSEIPGGIWNAVTDGEGRCTIKNVPADCRIYVNHEDHRFAQVAGVVNPMAFWHVPEEGEALIRLQQGKTVAGKVTFPDGSPAGGVEVRIWEKKSGSKQRHDTICSGNAFTDEDGRFSVFSLRKGTYDVVANVPLGEKGNWADLKLAEFEIEGKSPSTELNITLRKGAVISGRVTSDVEGIKLEGILVTDHAQNGVIKTQRRAAETDRLGKFTFRVAEGFHNIWIEQPGPDFASLQENRILVEVIEGGKGTANFHFLDPKKDPRVVSGVVIDESGNPVFAQLLSTALKGKQGADYWGLDGVQTDADGRFSIRVPLDVKNPFLFARGNIGTFENPDWLSGEKVYSRLTRVEPGKEASLQLLPRSRLGAIRGRLVDAGGSAIAGRIITLRFVNYGRDLSTRSTLNYLSTGPTLTGNNGQFETPPLVPDVAYQISVFDGRKEIRVEPKEKDKAPVIRPKPGETLDLGDVILRMAGGGEKKKADVATPNKKIEKLPPTPRKRQIFINSKFIEVDSKALKLPFEQTGHVVLSSAEYQTFLQEVSKYKSTDLLSAPTVLARENQNAKIEIVRKFNLPDDEGKKGGDSVDTGLVLDLIARTDGDGIHLKGSAFIREVDEASISSNGSAATSPGALPRFDGAVSFNTIESFFNKTVGNNETLILQCKRSEKHKGLLFIAISASRSGKGWPGPVNAEYASQVANEEIKQKFQVEPFVPGDFRKTLDAGVTVFTATAQLEQDKLNVQVFFNKDSRPDVRFSILTGRVFPRKKRIEGDEIKPLPKNLKIRVK